MNKKLNQNNIKHLWAVQIGLTLFLSALCALTFNGNAALSALLGGMVCIIPNVFFAAKLFKYQGAHAAKRIVSSFYQGEALKILLSIFLFTAVFVLWRITPLVFFGSYILIQMTHWVSPWIISNNAAFPRRTDLTK